MDYARRLRKAFRRLPLPLRVGTAVLGVVVLAFAANALYHVVRKPTELFFPVSGVLSKTPAETWRQYHPIFREHATAVITPELLAALAQVEGAGNPVARTYWRWQMTTQVTQIYRPASSAVGMYQMTDAMFDEARRYCIRSQAVVLDGPWHDWRSCWFNGLYARVVPSHAVEMTSAFLDRRVAGVLARHRLGRATLQQKQDLAAVIHLCGAAAGDAYAGRGFRLRPGERCGTHELAPYLARMNAMKRTFATMAACPPSNVSTTSSC